jgi:tripartite-type tricarboxylate transporter receptor subunit TctC
MSTKVKSLVKRIAGVLMTIGISTNAAAYPDKPINLVVVFGAGGTSDVVARQVGQSLGDVLKSEVVVLNRPGAGGNIGATSVAKSVADGHTLLAGFPGLTTNGALYQKLGYDPENDFIPISLVASAPNVIVVPATSGATTLKEFIAQAGQKPAGLSFGSAGAGSSSHLAGELLKEITGLNFTHVPYKGGTPALVDLASGRLDLMIIPLPEAINLINSGKIKALALASDRRSKLTPNIPTTSEAGLNNFVVGSWYGLLAPRGTPDNVVATLSNATSKALKSESLNKNFDASGIEMVASTPDEFRKFLADETKRWQAVIEKNKIRLD